MVCTRTMINAHSVWGCLTWQDWFWLAVGLVFLSSVIYAWSQGTDLYAANQAIVQSGDRPKE